MKGTLLLWLLTLISLHVHAQADRPAFHLMMDAAKTKKLITVDTVAGKARVLLITSGNEAAFLFVFQPGGEGTLLLETDANGQLFTKRVRNPAYYFAPGFLEKGAAWAAVDVPEAFGTALSRPERRSDRHLEAMSQVARALRNELPKAKLVLIGHSNGGVTAGQLAAAAKPVYDGFVLSAPNLSEMPLGWSPRQAKAPIKFITHANDDCGSQFKGQPISALTIRAAGSQYPLTVIKSPSPGHAQECFAAPAPHFFTGVYAEYTDAIMAWAATLK